MIHLINDRKRASAQLTLLALALVLGTGCGGGNSAANPLPPTTNPTTNSTPSPLRLEVSPKQVAVTANRQVQLKALVNGVADPGAHWFLAEGNPGGVSLTGLYYAPRQAGSYQVICRAGGSEERVTILVHPEPVAVRLDVDQSQVAVGGAVTFTPEFLGGHGVLLPWRRELTSGTPVTLNLTESAVAVLRVTNPVGSIDEKEVHIQVGERRLPGPTGATGGSAPDPGGPTGGTAPDPRPGPSGATGGSAPDPGGPTGGTAPDPKPGPTGPTGGPAPDPGHPHPGHGGGSGKPGATPRPGATGFPGGLWGTGDPDVFAVLYSSANLTAQVGPTRQAPTLINSTGSPAPVRFTLASGHLPEGLQLLEEGALAGTPATPGQYAFTIAISNGERAAESGPIVYTVAEAGELTLAYQDLSGLPVRTEIAAQAPALANATPGIPTSYSHSGDFPLGLRLAADGSIVGMPRREGSFTFTITARNWNRSASTTLTCRVLPGPAARLAYPDERLDTQDVLTSPVTLENMPYSPAMRFVASGLPEGLGFDPQGNITGTPRVAGTYTFTVTADDGIDSVTSAPVTYRVEAYTPLALNPGTGPLVLNPGERGQLNWTISGIPVSTSLTRDLAIPAPEGEAGDPERVPSVPIPVGDGSLSLPVTRRQTYTLRAQGRQKPGQPPAVATPAVVSFAVKGIEAVAGNPDRAYPAATYMDGQAGIGGYRRVTGAACHDGRVLFAEGQDHTVRSLNPADLSLARFAGVLRGPDDGIPFVQGGRLNNPGAMAVFNGRVFICDRGSATLKSAPVGDPQALDILAGHSGLAAHGGAADGPGAQARFGTLMDISVHPSGIAFVADLENGIRMVNLATGEVRTVAATPGIHHHQPPARPVHWHALQRPVAVAAAADGRLFLTTETKPGAARGANPMVQVLVPSTPGDLWNAAWTLNLFAGQESTGFSDGRGLHLSSAIDGIRNAAFNNPRGLVVVGDRLYVADTGNTAIRAIDLTTREVTTLAGELDRGSHRPLVGLQDGPGGAAHLRRPTRILAGRDGDELLVVDQDETLLRSLVRDASGQWNLRSLRQGPPSLGIAPEPWDGLGHQAVFKRPTSVVVNRLNGDAFVLDAGRIVRRISLLGAPARGAQPWVLPGQVSTEIGRPVRSDEGTDRPPATPLTDPSELGMDCRGRLYILQPKQNAILVRDGGDLQVFQNDLSDPLPPVAGRRQDLRIHMAVRPAMAGQGVAWSGFRQNRGGGQGPGWVVTVQLLAPARGARPAQTTINLPGEPQALAVDLDNRVHALITDPAHQVCSVHTFGQVQGAAGLQYEERQVTRFGPGVDQGRGFGLPEVGAMAPDSKGNLFLADNANGVVWMMPAAHNGEIFTIAGRPGSHQLPGQGTRGFRDPLYQPMGIAVTGADDLVITSGDALLQITAPGSEEHPWTPVTLSNQALGLAAQPAPRPAAAEDEAEQPRNPHLGGMAARQLTRNFDGAVAAYNQAVAARTAGNAAEARRLFNYARDQFELFLSRAGEDEEDRIRQIRRDYLPNIPAP